MFLTKICDQAGFIFDLLGLAINIVRWIIPVSIIVLAGIDVFKAASKDKGDTKELIKKLLTRFVYAVLIFFIPVLIKLIFNQIIAINDKEALSGTEAIISCIFDRI